MLYCHYEEQQNLIQTVKLVAPYIVKLPISCLSTNVPLLNMCQRAHLKPAETRCVEIANFKVLNEYFIAGVDLG